MTDTKHRAASLRQQSYLYTSPQCDSATALVKLRSLSALVQLVADKLQRVMNAAAGVVSGTKKYDRGLTHLLHSELHWLDVADRVTYKLGVTVYKCLHGQAPDYLSELCTPVAQVAERQHLHSASRHLLVVPRLQLDTYGRRTFAVAGTCSKTICVSRTCKLTVFVVH